MPNVGKSTLINRLIRHKTLKTAPTPGLTRSVSWVNLKGRYQLMDSPGLMLPRLENPGEALKLGWIGTIRDAAFSKERLAGALLDFLLEKGGEAVGGYYKLGEPFPREGGVALASIAQVRGLLRRGGAPDPVRAADQVLADFRKGNLGRFTLETPP
ncbi:50S ribosome-binding GTPase [candidate division KSB1 bacterium]|nr:50S ribosome-binding GTPase [candidate division KSB1 bacterium]